MANNDGKHLEQVVELLERSLDPNSRVEPNVWLPVLTSKEGAKNQCDIVVWSNQGAREIVTVFEVQDRGSQMTPNDVRGFIKKMEEVGAQRVVCVSRQDFSKSVKERARQSGGTIILMVIKDWDMDTFPDFFNPTFRYSEFSFTEPPDVVVTLNNTVMTEKEAYEIKHFPLDINTKIFTYDKTQMFSIPNLCMNTFEQHQEKTNSGKGELKILHNGKPQLFLYVNGKFYKAGIRFKYKYEWEITYVQPHMLSYDQDEHGTLAWHLEATYKTKEGPVIVEIPIVKKGGLYVIYQVALSATDLTKFSFSMKSGPLRS